MATNGMDRRDFERSLADRLIEAGKLDPSVLDRALRLRAQSEERLEALLVKLGLASERDVAEALARELGLPIAAAADYPDAPVLEERISRKFLRQVGALPLEETVEGLAVAMVDPVDLFATRALEMAAGLPVLRRVALPSELEAAQQRLFEAEPGAGIVERIESGADEELSEDVNRLRDLASEGPVIRLVSQLIARAVESRASDIHIEPFQNRIAVR